MKQLTSTSSWKGFPHHDTSSFMLNCGRHAFTIVFLTRASNTPLWSILMQLKSWFIIPHISAEPLWIKLSIFCQKNNSVFDVFFWDSNGFLTHLLDTKPVLNNLLVIVLLERVLFSEVLNSAHSFCRLLFLPLRTVNFSRWSSLHDEAFGLPDPFFLATLPVVLKRWPIILIVDREIGISSAFRALYISELLQLAWRRPAMLFLTATPAWSLALFFVSPTFTVGLTTLHTADLSLLYQSRFHLWACYWWAASGVADKQLMPNLLRKITSQKIFLENFVHPDMR